MQRTSQTPAPEGAECDVNPRQGRVETCPGSTDMSKMDPSEVLETALAQLGHFGLYQKYVVFMLCIPNLLAAMYSLNYIFVADQVPFRCVIPECEGSEVQFANESAASLEAEALCRRYRPLAPDQLSCRREDYHHNDTIPCDALVYQNYDTVFAEFDLGCRPWQRTLVGTVRNSALPLALLLTGYVSDTYGRRTAFSVFAACAGVLGLVKAFSVNYYMYITLEFFEAALGYGFNSAGYVMIVELARPSLRVSFACATGVAYGLGGVLLALVAARLRHWRHVLVAAYAPALLLPLYARLLDESARWLLATGRLTRAQHVIRKAARWNKVILDEEIMKTLENISETGKDKTEVSTWRSVVRSRTLLKRFAICCWCWVVAAFVYYGLTINSVSLSGDKYVNFALNMSMEVVASLLIMMSLERFGRKWCIFFAFLVSGIACVIPFFTSHSGTGLGLFFVGKLSITFAFNSVYVYTAEQFPTRARSSALAACSLVGRLGSVLAPQTPLLSLNVQALLYATSALGAALALLAGPETRRTPLPHSVPASSPPATITTAHNSHNITQL